MLFYFVSLDIEVYVCYFIIFVIANVISVMGIM